jgi:hypothetical protein
VVTDQEVDEAIDLWNKLSIDLGWQGSIRTKKNEKLRRQAFLYIRWAKKNHIKWRDFLEGSADYYLRLGETMAPFSRLTRKNQALREHTARRGVVVQADRKIPVIESAERKIRPATERFKSFYKGKEDVCARMQRWSGGYNPDSKWCAECPAKSSCIDLGRTHETVHVRT